MQEAKSKTGEKIRGSREKEEQKTEELKKEGAEKPKEKIKMPEKPTIIPENVTNELYKLNIEEKAEEKENIEEILKKIEDLKRSGLDSHYYPDRQFYADYEANLKKLEKLGYPHVKDLRKELIEKAEENIKRDKERYLKVRDLIQKYWNEKNLKKLCCLWMWLSHLKSGDAVENLKIKFDETEGEAEKILEDFLTDLNNCGIKETGTFVYTGVVHVDVYELTFAYKAVEKLLKEKGISDFFENNCEKSINDLSEFVKRAVYFLSQSVIFHYHIDVGEYVSTKLRFEEILKKFSGSEENVAEKLIKSGIIFKKVDRDLSIQMEIPSYARAVLKRIKEDPYSFGIEKTREIEEEVKKEIIKRGRAEGEEEKLIVIIEEETPEELEMPNFFELLLGEGFGRISNGKPICIIVEKTKEKLEELIAVLCRDIYREKVGGKPTPIYRNTIEDLRRDWNTLVERKIIIIKNIDVEKSREELFEMLKGFFSQDPGFLILVTSEPHKWEDVIRNVVPSEQIVTVGGLPPGLEKKEEEILRTVRGKKSIALAMSFGEEFKKSAENFDEELRKYLDYQKAPRELRHNRHRLTACSPTDYEKASDEHSAMKAFVWLYEWKRHDKRKIPDLETTDKAADVRIDDNNYEIETLFGIGDATSKLTEKMMNKYKYIKNEKIYFVLRNLDILRNLPILSTFRRDWRKAGHEVEFFGLDFDRKELVSLDKFVKLVKESKKDV